MILFLIKIKNKIFKIIRELEEKHGIHCNLTLLFSFAQVKHLIQNNFIKIIKWLGYELSFNILIIF